jgi:hypothetical protein
MVERGKKVKLPRGVLLAAIAPKHARSTRQGSERNW